MGYTVHTIPVPEGWSVEQAWEHITRGQKLEHPRGEPAWAVVTVEGLTVGPFEHDDLGCSQEITGGKLIRWHPADPQ